MLLLKLCLELSTLVGSLPNLLVAADTFAEGLFHSPRSFFKDDVFEQHSFILGTSVHYWPNTANTYENTGNKVNIYNRGPRKAREAPPNVFWIEGTWLAWLGVDRWLNNINVVLQLQMHLACKVFWGLHEIENVAGLQNLQTGVDLNLMGWFLTEALPKWFMSGLPRSRGLSE